MAITGDEKTTKSLSDIMQAQTVHLESLDAHPHPGKISEADEVSIAEEATGEHLPDGYYLSFNFIGTFVVIMSPVAIRPWSTNRWPSNSMLTTTPGRPYASRLAPYTCTFSCLRPCCPSSTTT